MTTENDDEFASFVRQRQNDIKRIAKRTRGEYQPAEVENVAWLLAQDMHSRKGIPIDFLNPDYQERLLSHVYQELVRYRETHVRHAIRLNHGSTDDDENEHPLMHTLVSDDGRDPLAELLAREAATLTQGVDISYSLAAAYAHLLGQFDNNLQAVADFLLISISGVRRRCSHAIWLAQHQLPIPLDHSEGSPFRLRPWRRFRFHRTPVQLDLPFAFREELALSLAELT